MEFVCRASPTANGQVYRESGPNDLRKTPRWVTSSVVNILPVWAWVAQTAELALALTLSLVSRDTPLTKVLGWSCVALGLVLVPFSYAASGLLLAWMVGLSIGLIPYGLDRIRTPVSGARSLGGRPRSERLEPRIAQSRGAGHFVWFFGAALVAGWAYSTQSSPNAAGWIRVGWILIVAIAVTLGALIILPNVGRGFRLLATALGVTGLAVGTFFISVGRALFRVGGGARFLVTRIVRRTQSSSVGNLATSEGTASLPSSEQPSAQRVIIRSAMTDDASTHGRKDSNAVEPNPLSAQVDALRGNQEALWVLARDSQTVGQLAYELDDIIRRLAGEVEAMTPHLAPPPVSGPTTQK